MKAQCYIVVLIPNGQITEAVGVYRSLAKAERDAERWGGIVLPLKEI
jgi:hypothetical protein